MEKRSTSASIYVRGVSNDNIKKNTEEGDIFEEKIKFLITNERWMLSDHKVPKRRDKEKADQDIKRKLWNFLEREGMWSTKEQESYWY